MPILPRVRGVLRSLAGHGPVQRELDAEIRASVEMLVDEKVAAGMDEGEARRQAQLEMGGAEQVKEAVRAARPAALLDTIARDTRFGVRVLAKTPAFSLTAIVVLALGIGANAAVFSLINLLCFRPLPGAATPGQPVAVYLHDPARPDSYRPLSYADYEMLRDQATVFDAVMAHATSQVGVTDGDTSRRTKAQLATGSYFAALGVRLAAGRTFSREEERPGSRASVMVLSHEYCERLGQPADVLGRTIVVNSHPFTVVGVAPAGFTGRMVLAGPEFWMPLGASALLTPPDQEAPEPDALHLMVVGRLKPGVTTATADGVLGRLSASLGRRPDGAASVLTVDRLSRFNQAARPVNDGDDGLYAALGALGGAALIVLVIASLNVANMQLARGASRRKEIAMRLALGASRRRIVGQLMIEGLILAAAGGALGLAASVWALHAVETSLASAVIDTLTADVWPDWRVLLACLASCTLSALAFALGPSLRLSRVDLLPEMKSQDGGGALRRLGGTRHLLVGAQVALSLALLAASGLFVRGAVAASSADPGYRFDRQLLVRLDAATGGLDEAAGREAYRQVIERIRSTPGVASASLATYVAFANQSSTRRVWRPAAGPRGAAAGGGTMVLCFEAGARYFETLGLPMLRGREFTLSEEVDATATRVAIIDEPAAAALFPGEDPVGQFLDFGPGASDRPVQVVGVAPGVRHRLSDARPVAHIYLPLGPHYRPLVSVHVRKAAGAAGVNVRAALRDTIRAADTKLAVLSLQTLAEARDSMPMNWIVRMAANTFGGFGLVALFMATIGLYGVKSYLVARRTREFGIRLALGANAGGVIRMVLKEGAWLLVVSTAAGFLIAVGLGQLVSSLLVGVRPFDPLVLSAATLVLAAAVFAACYVPARQATRVSPVTALRVE